MSSNVAEAADFDAWEQELRRSAVRRLLRTLRTLGYEAVIAYGATWVPHAMPAETRRAQSSPAKSVGRQASSVTIYPPGVPHHLR